MFTQNKKVLLILTVWPYPSDNGKKVVLRGLLEYFISKVGCENIDIVLINKEPIQYSPCKFLDIYKIFPSINDKIFNLIKLYDKRTIQEKILFSKRAEKEILNLIQKKNYYFIFADTIRSGQYISRNFPLIPANTKTILYMEDLFHIRYERILRVLNEHNIDIEDLNLLGNFQKNINDIPFVEKILNSSFFQRNLLKLETSLLKKREKEIVKYFTKVLLLNSKETITLRNISGLNNIYTISPLMDIENKAPKRSYNGNANFIFLGNLAVPHNSISLAHFLITQMEKCIKIIPDFKLIIIGKGANNDLKQLFKRFKNFIFYKEFVEDLSSYMITFCGMIVPLLFGSRIKLKVLEAFSFGLPLISTSFGLEGIEIDNSLKDKLLEEDINNFCNRMKFFLNRNYNNLISFEEIRFFHRKYSQTEVKKNYEIIKRSQVLEIKEG